jgi:hypothetical protein
LFVLLTYLAMIGCTAIVTPPTRLLIACSKGNGSGVWCGVVGYTVGGPAPGSPGRAAPRARPPPRPPGREVCHSGRWGGGGGGWPVRGGVHVCARDVFHGGRGARVQPAARCRILEGVAACGFISNPPLGCLSALLAGGAGLPAGTLIQGINNEFVIDPLPNPNCLWRRSSGSARSTGIGPNVARGVTVIRGTCCVEGTGMKVQRVNLSC